MKKSNLYGLIGSTLSCIILFLILWFVVISLNVNKPTEDEGLIVSFGNSNEGSGMTEMPAAKPTKTATSIKPTRSVKQDFMTQTDNSLAIAEQKRKNQKNQEQIDIEHQRLETEQKLANQKRKEQGAIDKASSINGLFGNGNGSNSGTGKGNGAGKGTGSDSGNGIQGNPAGNGTSGVGYALKLGNRTYSGNPAKPNYPKDVEGKITVNIRVDENGAVTSTSIGSPTTISDAEMRREAVSAANKTHFTKGKGVETGTITYNYNFKLK